MQNREIILDSLQKIRGLILTIQERSAGCDDFDALLHSPEGMMRLDAICMNLITLGEAVKSIDKLTQGALLSQHPEVYWSGVMRMRDKIAHHYFEIDEEIVERTVHEDIPPLLPVIEKMIHEL